MDQATLAVPNSETAPNPNASPRVREDWVDNLRSATILLVVNMHACVTYSWVGSWYYNSPPEPPMGAKFPFVVWQAHLQSFFMGLLFFFGGYYADRSLAKKGGGVFLRERFRRLVVPALFFMLVIHPFIEVVLHPGEKPYDNGWATYGHYLQTGRFFAGNGPMWFTLALFGFCAVLAALPKSVRQSRPVRVTWLNVMGWAAVTGLVTFLVRTVQPLETSVFNFQLAYFPQYVAAFALGVVICRADGLSRVVELGRSKASWAVLLWSPILLVGIIAASVPAMEHGSKPFLGGWNGIALALSLWEQVAGFALSVWIVGLFVRRFAVRTALSAWVSERSFAVYLLHAPILVALALLMQPYRGPAVLMAILLTALGIVASFALADVVLRIPLARRFL